MVKFLNFFILAFTLMQTMQSIAQAPQGIPYQAVARNSSGAILASSAISVRFTIRDSIATGAIKYRETFSVTTTAQGMFNVNVGQGSVVSGTFSGINWGTNAKFMQVEMDPAGGSSYIDMGTKKLSSVPYSLHAGSIKMRVSATGDILYSGGGNYVIIPGISAANNPPYPGAILGESVVCAGSTIVLTDSVAGGTWSSSNTSVATIGSTGIVTGVAPGTSIITYTVSNSFGSSHATTEITVNSLPSAATITGTPTICLGSATTLSITISGGTWSSSATGIATVGSTGVVSGVALGTATISYTVTSGCGSALSTRVVTVIASPSSGTITGPSTVAVSTTIALSSTVSGGTWSSSNTSIATVGTSGVVLGLASGSVLISYSVTSGGCSSIASFSITVDTLSLVVGATYGGGKIAYILQPGDPGYISGQVHGLIVSLSDQGGASFGCHGSSIGTSTAIGSGMSNTVMLSGCGGSAASICYSLVLSGYDDWYLPSLGEFIKIRDNASVIGVMSPTVYWSSSEINSTYAYNVVFNSDSPAQFKYISYAVRAVRSF